MSEEPKHEDKPERTPEEIAAEVEKTRAETRKTDAEARKAEMEATKTESEAETARLEAEQARMATEKMRFEHDRNVEKRERELAENSYHHIYNFHSEVDDTSVDKCIKELTYWHRSAPGCPIEIIFFSTGGSVIDGMALFDYIQHLRQEGHYVTTTAMGYAASLAGVLLQAGDKRVCGREAYVAIHEISSGAFGKIGEIEDEVEFVHKIQDRILDIFAERCKQSKADKPLSRATIKRRWRRKDWRLSSDECLKYGLVDEVR